MSAPWASDILRAERNQAQARVKELEAENDRLRAFFEGPAPEWEQANSTLKHRVRELEAALREALDLAGSMELALDQEFGVTGDPPSRAREEIERLSLVLKGGK